MKQYKILESLSEFLKNTILTKDINDMYYDERGEYCLDARIVENCPKVFEEIIELPYEIFEEDANEIIFSIIRKSDEKIFKIGDNITLKETRGIYIIDEFVIKDGDLFIVETDENGEDNHVINVLEELEGMSLELSSNSQEILEILENMQNFYKESFTKITKLLNK